MDEVVLNKSESIRRCIKRIEEDYDEEFENNYTKQDAVILNIQRAIQQTIDLYQSEKETLHFIDHISPLKTSKLKVKE